MLDVKVPLRLLKPGDRILYQCQVHVVDHIELGEPFNYVLEIVTPFKSVYTGDEEKRLRFGSDEAEITVLAASGAEVGQRVAAVLDEFDTQVRAHVARTFCRECGERECKRHA